MSTGSEPLLEEVVWHDLECGSYEADLALWEELAADAGGEVLELGAGTGRVALHLGRRGHRLTAVERHPDLAAELARRASGRGIEIEVIAADAAELPLDLRFALAIAPMQFVQELEPGARRALLDALRRQLRPGGILALALVETAALGSGESTAVAEPATDLRQVGDWVYASRPLWVSAGEGRLTVMRERERVGPSGELERSAHADELHELEAATLEREAAEAGLRALPRRALRNGPGEADSVVVLLEAP